MNDEILQNLREDLKDAASAILLVGSFADSLESKTSDIDLFVVLKSDSEFFPKAYTPIPIDGRKVEISFFTSLEVSAYLESSKRDVKLTNLRELEITYKLFLSKILQLSPEYQKFLSDFECGRFKLKLIQFYLRQSNGYYDDWVGHYLEGNWFSSVISIQSYLNTYVDAWLVSVGDMYPKPQHRIAKAIRQMKPEKLEAYCKILLPDAVLIRNNIDNYCRDVFITARRLQAQIFLGSADYLTIKKHLDPLFKVADWVYVYERGGEFYAKNQTRVYKISYTAYIVILSVSYAEEQSENLRTTASIGNLSNVKQLDVILKNLEKTGILIK
ncbi:MULTISPECIES: nucleotidyltransferase domain-containing protein [Pseudomonas]|uniref:nucleotidyltransferase domain-containing protein n=1 Tax=Pseudomonas TaxID=286 RepID=UPI000811E074|nr:nucleotidyltransferase domain-containing protein [Pseudomonas sp. 25 E 4]CRM12438.1 Nucleotidyltransferase domain protein [Pseudomonas sp. 25 E 4]